MLKIPQSSDERLEQIDKVALLTNKDPYKLALAKSQGSLSRMSSSYQLSMGWNEIKEWLHYNVGSVASKQHVASMLIDQQQKPTETLQEYVQKCSDLLLKSSSLLLHQAKDLVHITHFICNLHNQKLQHYVLGKNPTSVQNAITLAQKKDVELCIIEGLHNHDPGHEINNIYNKQHKNQNSNIGPCHARNGPHLIKDCEDSVCKRRKPNLDNHAPARCPRKRPPSRQQWSNPSYTKNLTRNQLNGHNDPKLQLSISTSKPYHIAELLETTKS